MQDKLKHQQDSIKNKSGNSRGISNLIGLVFLIFMSLVGAGMIFASLSETQIGLSPAFQCADLQLMQPIEIQQACYNKQTQDLELELKRSLSDSSQINSLEFLAFSEEQGEISASWSCGYSCGTGCHILNPGSTQKYFLQAETKPEILALQASGCSFESVKIDFCKN